MKYILAVVLTAVSISSFAYLNCYTSCSTDINGDEHCTTSCSELS
jgi:hypothetical protein